MRVDRHIRKLLLKQSETRVLSSNKCMYFGNIYTYPKITDDDRLEMVIELKRLLEPREYLIDRLKRILGVPH